MGIFDEPGEYDESSFWYMLRDPEQRALDQAVKARRELQSINARMAHQASGTDRREIVELKRQLNEQEQKLFSLGLYARTLLQVLLDKGILTNDEFMERMRHLDLLDGRLDGR